jgi:RNA polymerase sigma-70 factor, ECF subfamily
MEAIAVTSSARDRDLELVERHRLGDGDAFGEVYREHEATVYNLALRLSGDPFEAGDLTQEVFLRVFRHLGKFRGGSALRTWIYRVALNHCRSRLGRRRPPARSLDDPDDPAARELADPGRGPEGEALAHDTARRVEAALAALPFAFREAVVLRDLEGLSYEEIAGVLGTRIGTVRSRIARGRERLRQALESDSVERQP